MKIIAMIIGIPKEIKPQEYRVGLTPQAVAKLVQAGQQVLFQKGAGAGCGFTDALFRQAGAQIISQAKTLWERSELIIKIKEPLGREFQFFRPGLLLFTYLHLASAPSLTKALLRSQVTALGYETVTDSNGELPLLKPMSIIAGKLATQMGAQYLRMDYGTKGILLAHLEGARQGSVTILGAGNVGRAAMEIALALGARVNLVDQKTDRLEKIKKSSAGSLEVFPSDPKTLASLLKKTDLLIGAVLLPGAHAPRLVTRSMVAGMQPGSVIVDVSIDQGGCIETIRPTTHARPVFTYRDVLHYGVTNMPSLVAHSATEALVYTTLPYIQTLASQGLKALDQDPEFKQGLQTYQGKIVHARVREAMKGKSG